MTEYDFSPEAYERYLATQNRIVKWVEQIDQHKAEFENPIQYLVESSDDERVGAWHFHSMFSESINRIHNPL